jgi:hybrid cluster-associated redox disulfide protein
MTPRRASPISADWTIDALLNARSEAPEVLLRHGMACTGCIMARFETLAEAAREYGVNVNQLIREIGDPQQSKRARKAAPSSKQVRARRGRT